MSARRNLQLRKRRRAKLQRPAKICKQMKRQGKIAVWSGTKLVGFITGE